MRTKNALSLVLGVVALLGWGAVASAQSWNPTPGGPVFNTVRYYSAGQTVTLETYSLAPATADTTLRLFRLDITFGIINEVAWDGDSGTGYASKLTWTVPAGQSGYYRVAVHSFFASSAGTFSMYETKNGTLTGLWTNKEFGGAVAYVPGVTAGNLLQTGFEAGDDVALNHQLLVLDPNLNGVTFTAPNGPSNTAVVVAPSTTSHLWVVAGALDNVSGALWLFHNDAPNMDSDIDGLGDNLEQAIGTCVSQTDTVGSQNKVCIGRRSKDSDLDGLSDYHELLGVDEATEDLPLRRWGAHPLHKDIFAEVDWDFGLGAGYLLTGQWNDLGQPPGFATRLRDGYNDGTAAELDNPDGVAGIDLHFDVNGVSPWLDKDTNLALFFDGGGSSRAVDACSDYKARRLDSMNVARRPYFHYVCVDTKGDGVATRPGLSVRVWNGTDGAMLIHELGHNLGLSHGGFEAFNGKPNYVSVMNYGFPGDDARTYNGNSTYFSHEFHAARILNPEHLCESAGLSPGTNSKVNNTTSYFFGTSGSTAVDWDRNDVVSGCSTQVTAVVNWYTRRNRAGWSNTSAFATHRTDVTPSANTTLIGTPALAAAPEGTNNTRAYVFYPLVTPTVDTIGYRSAVFPDGKCANPVTAFSGTCTTFSAETNTSIRGRAVAAATFTHSGQPVVFIAVRDLAGALRVYRSAGVGPALSFTLERVLAFSGALGEPSMVVVDNALWVAWQQDNPGADPWLMSARRLDPQTWGISVPVEVNSVAQTSTLSPTLARRGGSNLVYLLRGRTVPKGTGTVEALQFLYRHPSTGLWYVSSEFQLDNAVAPTDIVPLDSATKPGLAWHAASLDAPEGPGAWLISTTRPTTTGFSTEMNVFDGHTDFGGPDGSTGPDLITGTLDMDAGVGGVALLDDALLRHVQGAFVRTDGDLRYLPYADGIFPYDLKDHDDYAYLKVGPCRSLVGDHCEPTNALPPFYPTTSSDDDCSWGAP